MNVVVYCSNRELHPEYSVVDNTTAFNHNGVEYSIDFIDYENSSVILHRITLGIDENDKGYAEYNIGIELTTIVDRLIISSLVFVFCMVDIPSNNCINLKVYWGSGKYILKGNISMIEISSSSAVVSYRSRSVKFIRCVNVSDLLKCFDFNEITCTSSNGNLLIETIDGYIRADYSEIINKDSQFLNTFRCYYCEYKGYEFYVVAFNPSKPNQGFHRMVVKDCKVVCTNKFISTVGVNKRLL